MFGITFEEKILSSLSITEYLELIESLDVKCLEIGLDGKLAKSIQLDLRLLSKYKLNFHVPYHLSNEYLPQFLNINNQAFKSKYEYYLGYINSVVDTKGIKVVLHCSDLHDDQLNLSYIDFIMNMNERQNLGLEFLLETTYDAQTGNFYNREQLMSYIMNIGARNLNLCVDIAHELRMPTKQSGFNEYIHHVHFHGYNDQKDHIALNDRIIDATVKLDRELQGNADFIFELLMTETYLDDLRSSLEKLHQKRAKGMSK